MPIEYTIDKERRLVLARGHGVVTHDDVHGYQKTVWSKPEVSGFDEIVDMTDVERIAVPSTDSVRDLASLSAGMDVPYSSSRFAIVAPQDVAYGLGRMYQIYRGLDERSTKKVSVFRTRAEAFDFLGMPKPAE